MLIATVPYVGKRLHLDPDLDPDPKLITDPDPNMQIISDPDPQPCSQSHFLSSLQLFKEIIPHNCISVLLQSIADWKLQTSRRVWKFECEGPQQFLVHSYAINLCARNIAEVPYGLKLHRPIQCCGTGLPEPYHFDLRRTETVSLPLGSGSGSCNKIPSFLLYICSYRTRLYLFLKIRHVYLRIRNVLSTTVKIT
jgi:hypothetical protein